VLGFATLNPERAEAVETDMKLDANTPVLIVPASRAE
jgi:hypothetical protein